MVRPGLGRRYVAVELGDQRVESRIRRSKRFRAKALDDVAAPLGEVLDSARESVGVQRQSKHVDRWFEKLRCGAFRKQAEGAVRGNQLPIRTNDDGGTGHV